MILDTNAISALAEKDTGLISRLEDARSLSVTLFSLGEYLFGVRGSRYRSELEAWLRNQLLARVTILGPELATVEHYADIRHELGMAGTPIPANDIWIAALCREHDEDLLSRDTHFDRVSGVRRIGW